MDDAERVRLGDALEGLQNPVDDPADRERPARGERLLEQARQVGPLEHFEHHVRGTPGSSPASRMRATCSFSIPAAARASLRNRLAASRVAACSSEMNLSATWRSSSSCRAT